MFKISFKVPKANRFQYSIGKSIELGDVTSILGMNAIAFGEKGYSYIPHSASSSEFWTISSVTGWEDEEEEDWGDEDEELDEEEDEEDWDDDDEVLDEDEEDWDEEDDEGYDDEADEEDE